MGFPRGQRRYNADPRLNPTARTPYPTEVRPSIHVAVPASGPPFRTGPNTAPGSVAVHTRQSGAPTRSDTSSISGSRLTRPANESLAIWFLEAQSDVTGDKLWQLMQSRGFARLWYGARSAGELLRSWCLEALYTQRGQPGGAHPDPREPAAFSRRAVLTTAASMLGLRIWQVPEPVAQEADKLAPPGGHPPLTWLITYPERRPAELAVRLTPHEGRLYFDMACLIGYVTKERDRLLDPDAPAGLVLLPQDAALTTVLHQFAIALLALERDCPPHWSCHCNALRTRYNTPPPDHATPTDALSIQQLRAATATGPHPAYPYPSQPSQPSHPTSPPSQSSHPSRPSQPPLQSGLPPSSATGSAEDDRWRPPHHGLSQPQ